MDNSKNRLNDVFLYGLYMDEEILKNKGIVPKNRREAFVKGYRIRIGNSATLLRDEDSKTYGMVYSLTHDEIKKLYQDLSSYTSEALLIEAEGEVIPALCYVLLDEPAEDEKNEEYFHKLIACLDKYTLPKPIKV